MAKFGAHFNIFGALAKSVEKVAQNWPRWSPNAPSVEKTRFLGHFLHLVKH